MVSLSLLACWKCNVGCDGTRGSFRYAVWNADSSMILEFADRLNLVICNTRFMKQESKVVTCGWFCYCSLIVHQGDKAKVRNVNVIPIEECVP